MFKRDPYFEAMPERPALVWATAVRRQLARWEPLVAKHALMTLEPHMTPPPPVTTTMSGEEYWQAETEHHLLLVAARNLMKAIAVMDQPPAVDLGVYAELVEARDLLEHWTENMPVFNVTPRPGQPGYPSGKAFAARNPARGPYCWWAWGTIRGPLVTPNVSAQQLRDLTDATIQKALETQPQLADYVPIAPPSSWERDEIHGWWPRRG